MADKTPPTVATHVAQAGWGYDYYPTNFGRFKENTPVAVAPKEYAKPGYVIVYRISDGLRMHVKNSSLKALTT